MEFSEMLTKLKTSGKQFRRTSWPFSNARIDLYHDTRIKTKVSIIKISIGMGGREYKTEYTPSNDDLFATDWIEYEKENTNVKSN